MAEQFKEDDVKDQVKRDNLEDHIQGTMSNGEVLRFLCYSLLFVIIVLNQLNIESTYHLSTGVKEALIKSDDYEELSTADELVEWLRDDLLALIITDGLYSEQGTSTRINWFNRIITPLRLVQRRVELIDNPSERFEDFVPYVWEVEEIPLYDSDVTGESTDNYGPGKLFEYDGSIGVDNSGGFQILLETEDLIEAQNRVDFVFSYS